MASADHFRIIENCLKCPLKEDRLFCDLPDDVLQDLQEIKATSFYPKGALLSLEGQPPRGVYILCTGRAKLSSTSADGKSIILRIAEPGEVLGLTAVIGNTPYEATAEILEPTQANFISRQDFMRFLDKYSNVGMKVAHQLTHNCRCAYEEVRSLGLSKSVPEKIARLLLQWSAPVSGREKEAGRNRVARNSHPGRDSAICRQFARDRLPRTERLQKKRLAADQRRHLVHRQQARPGKAKQRLASHAVTCRRDRNHIAFTPLSLSSLNECGTEV